MLYISCYLFLMLLSTALYGAATSTAQHPTLYQLLLPHLVNPKVDTKKLHPGIQHDVQELRVQRYTKLRQDALRPFIDITADLEDLDVSAATLNGQTREAVALGMVIMPQETASCRDRYARMLAVYNITPTNVQLACAGLAFCSMVGSFALAIGLEKYGASWILAFPVCIGSIACLINTTAAKHLCRKSLLCNSRIYMQTLLPIYVSQDAATVSAPQDQQHNEIELQVQPLHEMPAVNALVSMLMQKILMMKNSR